MCDNIDNSEWKNYKSRRNTYRDNGIDIVDLELDNNEESRIRIEQHKKDYQTSKMLYNLACKGAHDY